MRIIELSAQAQKRLDEIIGYHLLHESAERTAKVLNSFDTSFQKIAANPFAYKKFVSGKFINIDIRFFLHYKTYHIYFIVYPHKIIIAEIFHLSQSKNKLLLDI